jgi:hypothetical protein
MGLFYCGGVVNVLAVTRLQRKINAGHTDKQKTATFYFRPVTGMQ